MIASVIFFTKCIDQGWGQSWSQPVLGLNLTKESKYIETYKIAASSNYNSKILLSMSVT